MIFFYELYEYSKILSLILKIDACTYPVGQSTCVYECSEAIVVRLDESARGLCTIVSCVKMPHLSYKLKLE